MQKIRVVLATGNEIRHRYIASKLSNERIDFFSIHETKNEKEADPHFKQRAYIERLFFEEQIHNNYLKKEIPKGEINSDETLTVIQDFKPDFFLTYGCSIVCSNVINKLECVKINTHLGLSPYYRGTGTNFWPIFNNQLEYCGVTFHELTTKIDGGSIFHQFSLEKKTFESVHHLGNSLIRRIPDHLAKLIRSKLTPIKQDDHFFAHHPRLYYRNSDFSSAASNYVEKNFGAVQKEFLNRSKCVKIWSRL